MEVRFLPRAPMKKRLKDLWWYITRSGPPPHAVKQQAIRYYARQSTHPVFLETGTFLGEMVEAVKDDFKKIISIELDKNLATQAKQKFARYSHISIIEGDSGKLLPELLKDIREPSLFWLDGHYSAGITAKGDKDTPIEKELEAILAHPVKGHIILIDDARLFDGTGDYPKIYYIEKQVRRKYPNAAFMVKNDSIRILL
jgi:hypothetical protein